MLGGSYAAVGAQEANLFARLAVYFANLLAGLFYCFIAFLRGCLLAWFARSRIPFNLLCFAWFAKIALGSLTREARFARSDHAWFV